MAASAGRRRYRWFVLLSSAVVLLVWMFTPAPRDDAGPGVTSTAPLAPPPPPYTAAADAPTTFPSTPPAPAGGSGGLPTVRLADLPPEAVRVVRLVDRGGSVDDDGDGSTFRNDGGVLPVRAEGHYRAYPVPDRASRIVVGADGEIYRSADEDGAFVRVER